MRELLSMIAANKENSQDTDPGKITSAIGGLLNYADPGMGSILKFLGKAMSMRWQMQREQNLPKEYKISGFKDEIKIQEIASIGQCIPIIYGICIVKGSIICNLGISAETSIISYKKGKSIKTRRIIEETIYEYFASFAVAICQGEVDEIIRIWANDELLNINDYQYNIYYGSNKQSIDPLIFNTYKEKTPAFNELCYIVFDKFPISNFNNTIPKFTFEVRSRPKADNQSYITTEQMVKSMVIIPGTGEFVYDTKVQYKEQSDLPDDNNKIIINMHNIKKVANSLCSLDQMIYTCENIEWVAVVVCWFGSSLDAQTCDIFPAVEYKTIEKHSEEWQVAGFTRKTARLISKNPHFHDTPMYGGTVNDNSLLRYIKELKSRGLKVMLYPMFFLDVEQKPWRGHVTGSPDGIRNFFKKSNGYNDFILHYAKLVQNEVDAFIIGSELKGLTKVIENNNFPAVFELKNLAKAVKDIMHNVSISYAADWSEYHHTDGGFYNLDPLWADTNIDFVGIDAYFPLTDSNYSNITINEIKQGWTSGEGYDYYIDGECNKHSLGADWAWKNIEHWWKTKHTNPDGKCTPWEPKMKKIWFTEFGFPSIDKATNQPNIFFDPYCYNGGIPKKSSGITDFHTQRLAIRASLEKWKDSEFIERMFLWTWDARPYPAWPYTKIWTDGYLWEKGHWVNNKFGSITIAQIILDSARRIGLNTDLFDVSQLDEPIEGLIITTTYSFKDILSLLRTTYFFDIQISEKKIKFVKRGAKPLLSINTEDLIRINKKNISHTSISDLNLISDIKLKFLNSTKHYAECQESSNLSYDSNEGSNIVHLPIVMQPNLAKAVANIILQSSRLKCDFFVFFTTEEFSHIRPTDVINIFCMESTFTVYITKSKWQNGYIKFTSVIEDISVYSSLESGFSDSKLMNYHQNSLKLIPYPIERNIQVIEIPALSYHNSLNSYLIFACVDTLPQKISFATQNSDEYKNHDIVLNGKSIIGTVDAFYIDESANEFMIDRNSYFIIKSGSDLSATGSDDIYYGRNYALVGNEIIKYEICESLGNNCYKLSNMIRGISCTEKYIQIHQKQESFILIDSNTHIVEFDIDIPFEFSYFAHNQEKIISIQGLNKQLPLPILRNVVINKNIMTIEWYGNYLNSDDWIKKEVRQYKGFNIEIFDAEKVKINCFVEDLQTFKQGITGMQTTSIVPYYQLFFNIESFEMIKPDAKNHEPLKHFEISDIWPNNNIKVHITSISKHNRIKNSEPLIINDIYQDLNC